MTTKKVHTHTCDQVECSAYALRELKSFKVGDEGRALPNAIGSLSIAELLAHSITEGASIENLAFEISNLIEVLNALISARAPDGSEHQLGIMIAHKFSILGVVLDRLEAVAHDASLTCDDSKLHREAAELNRIRKGASCDAE